MWKSLRSRMLVPLSGDEVKRGYLEPPNLRCIIRLINAVRDAGASLHHLDIKLSSLGQLMDLVPAPNSRPLSSSGMQQLRTLLFTHDYSGRNMHEDDGQDSEEDDKGAAGLLELRRLAEVKEI
jgi:hypothetical protein